MLPLLLLPAPPFVPPVVVVRRHWSSRRLRGPNPTRSDGTVNAAYSSNIGRAGGGALVCRRVRERPTSATRSAGAAAA